MWLLTICDTQIVFALTFQNRKKKHHQMIMFGRLLQAKYIYMHIIFKSKINSEQHYMLFLEQSCLHVIGIILINSDMHAHFMLLSLVIAGDVHSNCLLFSKNCLHLALPIIMCLDMCTTQYVFKTKKGNSSDYCNMLCPTLSKRKDQPNKSSQHIKSKRHFQMLSCHMQW